MRYLLLLVLFSSCLQSKPEIETVNGSIFGTRYMVKFRTQGVDYRKDRLTKEINEYLAYLNNIYSTYEKNSELSKVNQLGAMSELFISKELREVLELSKLIHQESEGAFDVTLGPVVNAWGFGPMGLQSYPKAAELNSLRDYVGVDKFKIDSRGNIIKKHAQVYIDLSAVAKGYAVDKLAWFMDKKGASSYLIEIGGEVRAKGVKPDGQFWRVGIEKPQFLINEREIQKVIELQNTSMATSGSYRNYRKFGEKVFSHTISPKTFKPVEHKLISATVVSSECAVADAWATAMMVLGPDDAIRIANKNNLAVYLLVKKESGFKALKSAKFNELMKE